MALRGREVIEYSFLIMPILDDAGEVAETVIVVREDLIANGWNPGPPEWEDFPEGSYFEGMSLPMVSRDDGRSAQHIFKQHRDKIRWMDCTPEAFGV